MLGLVLLLGPVSARAFDRLRYQEYPALEGRNVTQVLILGNNHTHDVVFLREMRTEPGLPFSSKELWRDWERITDLGIFANVEVEAVPSGDEVLVVVSVYERPRWLAAPILDYDVFSRELTYGFSLRFRNLDGMNRQFRIRGIADDQYNQRLSVQWSTPWIGERRQSVGMDLNLERAGEDEARLSSNRLTVGTSKFLGDFKDVRKGVNAFAQIEVLNREGNEFIRKIEELSPGLGAGVFRDTRNVRVDPGRGTSVSANLGYFAGWVGDDLHYLRGSLDLRGFQSLGWGLIVGARAQTVISVGRVPDYRRVGVGGSGSIRGQPTDVATGENLARASMELRFPLLPHRRFGLPIPFVPQEVKNVDIRIDGVLFVDAGSAWENPDVFSDARLFKGGGFGLRVFLPVFEVGRVELAFDEDGNATFYFQEGNFL